MPSVIVVNKTENNKIDQAFEMVDIQRQFVIDMSSSL